MSGNLRRSRDGIVGRRSGLGRFLLKGPRLAAILGPDNRALESACGALLLIAEGNPEQGRKHEVAEARILVGGGLALPLIDQRVLPFRPRFAAIVGRPDSSQLAHYPTVIVIEEVHAVKHRLHVGQRVIPDFFGKYPLESALEET